MHFRFNVSINWGYNAPMHRSFHEDMYRAQGDVEIIPHTFTEVCNCVVNVTVWNDINTLTETVTIVVQDPFQDITMSVVPTLAVEENDNTSQATITITKTNTATPVPTAPQVVLYSDNAANDTVVANLTGLNSQGASVDLNFDYEVGRYCPVANLSNLVDSLVISGAAYCIDVQQRLAGLEIQASALLGTSKETVITSPVTLRWGTDYQLEWIWKDGSNDQVNFTIHTDSMVRTHIYTAPGSYVIAAKVTNIISTELGPTLSPVSVMTAVVIENKIVPENTTIDGVGITQIGTVNDYSEAYDLFLIVGPGTEFVKFFSKKLRNANHICPPMEFNLLFDRHYF